MRRVSNSWMAVAAAVVLLGALVGVVWARPNDRPQAADITRKVTLGASDFIPHDDANNWMNYGHDVWCEAGICGFTAPVVFPCLPSVTVERIKLHVDDGNGTETAEASIYRSHPSTGVLQWLGEIESPGPTSGGLQTYTSPDINKVVWPSQRAYVYLGLYPDIHVFGVTVEYHRNI